MLAPGRLPLSPAESETIDRLLASHAGQTVSLTRRDPGETGPVLVHVDDDSWLVDDAGTAVKQRKTAR